MNKQILKYSLLFFTFSLLMIYDAKAQYVNLTEERGNNTNESRLYSPRISLDISSGFTSYGNSMNHFSTSVSPKILLPVNRRFSIVAGIGYTTLFTGQNSYFGRQNLSYGSVFAGGNYMLNDKVQLSGIAYSTINFNNPVLSDNENTFQNFEAKGVAFDVEYRVNDNFRINVGFKYHKQNTPLYYDPFFPLNGGNFTSPFNYQGDPFYNQGF